MLSAPKHVQRLYTTIEDLHPGAGNGSGRNTDYGRLTPAFSLGTLKPFLGSRNPLNNDPLFENFDDLPLKPSMEFVDSCGQEEQRTASERFTQPLDQRENETPHNILVLGT